MTALDQIETQLRRSVSARALAGGAAARVPGPRLRVRARRPRVLVCAALAVALAGVAVGLGLSAGAGSPGPSPAIAAVFERLARIAASGPSLVPKRGQFLFVRSVDEYAAITPVSARTSCVSFALDHREVWIAADGSGLLRETGGPPRLTSGGALARCVSFERQQARAVGTSNLWFADRCFELGPGGDLQSLSTDPRTLLRQMRRIEGGPRTPAEDFAHVGDFLRETDASPALRAALYRAAALIPGVHLLGTVHDHFGRPGLGVAIAAHGTRSELIFNPHTAALMGEQTTGRLPGTDGWAVYLSSRVVDRQPYPSPVPLRPACRAGAGFMHQVRGGTAMTGQPVR